MFLCSRASLCLKMLSAYNVFDFTTRGAGDGAALFMDFFMFLTFTPRGRNGVKFSNLFPAL